MAGQGDGHFVHLRSQRCQHLDRLGHGVSHLWLHHIGVQQLLDHAHPFARQVPVQSGPIVGHGNIPRVGVVGIVTGDGLKGEGAVFHRSR